LGSGKSSSFFKTKGNQDKENKKILPEEEMHDAQYQTKTSLRGASH